MHCPLPSSLSLWSPSFPIIPSPSYPPIILLSLWYHLPRMVFIFHVWQSPSRSSAFSFTFSHPCCTESKCAKFKSAISFWWNHFSGSPSTLKAKLSKHFWKGPDSKCFKLCRSDSLCPCCKKAAPGNPQMNGCGPFSVKLFVYKTGVDLDFACRP